MTDPKDIGRVQCHRCGQHGWHFCRTPDRWTPAGTFETVNGIAEVREHVSAPIEIVIDAAAFEDALEEFTKRATALIEDQAETLAYLFRDRLLKAICAHVDGRQVNLTVKTVSDIADTDGS